VSDEGLEAVRDLFAATNEGDTARATSHFAEDVELLVPEDGFLLAGHFSGREAVLRWFADWFSSFERGFRFDVAEILDPGGDQVLVVSEFRARGRSSGLETHAPVVAWLYRTRGREIVRAELFTSREAALAAAAGRR
jgi:ketosteroid isomerase-like protein